MTRNIDELNNLNTRAEEPEEYFKKMDLPEEEKERRVEYTKKANEIFDLILVLALLSDDKSPSFFASLRDRLETYLITLINEYTVPDDYLIDYASDTAFNFVDTTEKHIDDPWYTSEDRALFNAENGANDVLNYDLYLKAIADGKTHKKWITEKDNRVRKTHRPLDGKTIGIKELFYVGGIPMRFPKDYEYAEAFPQELINCRCSIVYLPKDKEDEKSPESKQNRVVNNNTDDIIERGKMIAGTYPVTNDQINDVLNNELSEFTMPVQPVYNPRIKSQGLTKAKEQYGIVTITKIEIGKQVKNTRECLIDSLLHEYLESQIMLNKNTDAFYSELYKSGDKAIHTYINDYIREFFKAKGLDYGLA